MSKRPLHIILLGSRRQWALLCWCPFYQCWTVLLIISPWLLLQFHPLLLSLGIPEGILFNILLLVLLMNELGSVCISNHLMNWCIDNMVDHICLPWCSCTSIMAAHSSNSWSLLCLFNSSFNSWSMLSLLLVGVFPILLSFQLCILIRIQHINSFLVMKVIYFLENNLASDWVGLIVYSLRI